MTEIEMRRYLEEHFYAEKKIKALEAEKKQKRLNAQGGAISYEENNTATKSNNTEIALMKIADEEIEIDSEITALRTKQREIRDTISHLHDNDLESVLILKYIAHYKDEAIARELHYAPRTVQSKLSRAIKRLSEKICV